MHTFALNGEPLDGAAILKFIMILKRKVMASEQPDLLEPVVKDQLISVIWMMIYRELDLPSNNAQKMNPLIPRLLMSLFSFKRDKPLSRIEHLQLYQIQIWIDTQIENLKLPSEFGQCIPTKILSDSERHF